MSHDPRILIIRRRYLGDIVLLSPVLRNLRRHWPASRLFTLVEPAYAEVLRLLPEVDAVVPVPRRLRDWPRFLGSIRAARFTHVFDFDNTERTALITRASGARFRLALHHGDHRVKLRRAYTQIVHDPAGRHEQQSISEYYLGALRAAGVPVASAATRLIPRSGDVAEMRALVGDGRTLLVHPGSRSAARIWPMDRFAAVCRRVQNELGVPVALAGGPGEQSLLEDVRRRAECEFVSVPDTQSILRFAALAQCSALLLCHDSGPMHVAAAVGTRVVALLGSQNAKLFAPTGDGHTLLQPPLPCAGACAAPRVCVRDDSYRSFCVRRLSVEAVFAAVKTALASRRA